MQSNWWLNLLRLCVSLTVLSRGWLTWKWDSPIRSIFWNEDWWGRFIDWENFALKSDAMISGVLSGLGIFLILGAVVPWIDKIRWLLFSLSLVLFIDSAARFIDSGFQVGMGIEHSLQWACPVLLYLALSRKSTTTLWMKIASALTFVGHGLYASGLHPVPLKYHTMTSAILHLEEKLTSSFLMAAGLLDFCVALAIFWQPWRKFALIYMVIWGTATAFARVLAGSQIDPWLMETVVRSSHWMVPLFILAASSCLRSER